MPKPYQPPFTITPAIISLISVISENLGRLSVLDDDKNLRLRRANRIRTIQGSLAIEGNTLHEAQITAILEGKRVIAPPKEVQEVRNAIKAYELFDNLEPASEDGLLKAHLTLMTGLIEEPGLFRSGNVGVMNGDKVVHMGPPADRVPGLIRELLEWLAVTDQHPLIASSVFHYEFEFIHPFADGNGRMGRLWQTLILSRWNSLLAQLPVESMVHEHQNEYYQAINQSTAQSDSAPFIEFMLRMIAETVAESLKQQPSSTATPQETPQVTPQVKKLLEALAMNQGEPMSRDELQLVLELKDRKSFRELYLKPALTARLIEMTIPDKPNSRLQRYRLCLQE